MSQIRPASFGAPRTLVIACALTAFTGCGGDDGKEGGRGPGVHMAEMNADFTKLYMSLAESNEVIVVDTKSIGADTSPEALRNRAYVVSEHSDELTVIDLRTLELISSTRDYKILKRIAVGAHPTHMSLTTNGQYLAVMNEDEGTGAVSFIETTSDVEVKRLGGFYTPHFMRYSADGLYGYVANFGAHHITRVDLGSLEIDGHIPLDGHDVPPNVSLAPGEGGFGDAQIDESGVLYAAGRDSGKVLVYDTVAGKKLPELTVGKSPWVAFAEHPFTNIARRHLVPNFGDRTVSLIDAAKAEVVAALPGDEEAYGVNFSPVTPDHAFVMNRVRADVAVVDTANGRIVKRIPVGGNTETAATSADGKYVIAAVSSANRVVVIDALTKEVVKFIDHVGSYPWSVTIPMGQNYCH
jgi:YVTN family beta-propeller protein